ncbi:MAG: DUF4184 family protein [Hymenobacteraceae bacterium]|nr:DUF4184 family protein [Hymenobacteraceae bacterium]MDX5480855.1 DUF4184 family protein [Hymenobacteraceae bacterium]
MPFTAAHPAIILPLLKAKRQWLSTTGLVIGSMAPDFEYFLRLRRHSDISHTLPGLLFFDLPIAFLLAVLFHGLVREHVVDKLPLWLKRRALPYQHLNWFNYLRRHWFIFCTSALLGAATHIFWDSFTHTSGFFVEQFPVLLYRVSFLGLKFPLCRLIQHISTVLGLLLILLYVLKLPAVPLPKPEAQKNTWWKFWLKIFLSGCGFLVLNVLVRAHLHISLYMLGYLVPTLISGWLLALLFISSAAKRAAK